MIYEDLVTSKIILEVDDMIFEDLVTSKIFLEVDNNWSWRLGDLKYSLINAYDTEFITASLSERGSAKFFGAFAPLKLLPRVVR